MAKIYGCGWEMNTPNGGFDTPFTKVVNGSATITISSTIKNQINNIGGKYSVKLADSGTAGSAYYLIQWRSVADGSSNGPFYFRFYLRCDAAPSMDNPILYLLPHSGGGSTLRGALVLNSAGALELWDNNSQIGSDSSSILNDGTFHCIEMYFKNNVTNMALEMRVDGVVAATGTTTDSIGGIGSLNLGHVALAAGTNYVLYLDDFIIDDAAYPGPGVQIILRPNAAGDTNNLSSGTGQTFAEFDEETPDDGTTYSTLPSNNNTVFFKIDDPSVQGMGPSDTINVIMVGYRWKADTTGTCSLAAGIKSQVSGTIAYGTTVLTSVTAKYYSNYGADPNSQAEKYYCISATDPQVGGVWTRALLQTTQIGIKAVDADPDIDISTIWALVDFVPSTVTQGTVDVIDPEHGTTTATPAGPGTDHTGFVYRTCTDIPLTIGANGVTSVDTTGLTEAQVIQIQGLIPGCTVSVAPYYQQGSTTVYGSTTTSSTPTPATASDTRGCAMLGGII